jgi:alkanesulfonate monooxygenase SsuD/methylene tetrahydromethanopterin reductase-like flavin-dependent oxidoreductase (luciferase family)
VTGLVFGVNINHSVEAGHDPVAQARLAEDLGFDFVSMNDHVHGPEPRYEAWTALSWIAAQTSRVGVMPRVLGVPYRYPAMVAKMAETFDRLSGDRLILGLGAGASDEEFRALGMEVRSPREKIGGLEEAIKVIRGLWSDEHVSFEGDIYRTREAEIQPKPQRRIPIWLGSFGPRALHLTGRLADGWIPSLGFAPPERIPEMRKRLMEGMQDAGREPGDLVSIYNIVVDVGDVAASDPSVISGRPQTVADRLLSFLTLGFSGFNFVASGPDVPKQMERLAGEVIPLVRSR